MGEQTTSGRSSQTREFVWQWALENFQELRDYAQRKGPKTERPTSLVLSVLSRIFSKSTSYLRGLRSLTAVTIKSIRNKIIDRGVKDARLNYEHEASAEEIPAENSHSLPNEDERMILFKKTWECMQSDEQELLRTIALDEKTYREAAESLGSTDTALRKKMQGIREKFKTGLLLMKAMIENSWEPGNIKYRLVVLRFFQGNSIETLQQELGCSRQRVELWLGQVRVLLPVKLRATI